MNNRSVFSPLKNQHGNSLVGVIAAGVISGVIGLGTYSMISSQIKAQKLVGASSEKTILRAQIQGILGDSQVCASALKDSSNKVAKFNPDSVLPTNPTAGQKAAYEKENSLSKIALAGMILSQDGAGSGGLLVINHTLKELDKNLRTSVTVNGVAGKRIVGQLQIDLGRTGSSSPSPITSSMAFPLFLVVNDVPGASKFDVIQCGLSNVGGGGNPPPPSTPNVAWISIAPGGTQMSTHVRWTDSLDHSPIQTCINAGYTSFTGACRTVVSGRRVQGSLVSNQTTYFPNWALSCSYGNGAYFFATTVPSEILCIK